MRHEQQRRAVPRLHPRDQAQHLFLHRHVERGRRLVRDDQLRLGGEGRGDQDALAHPARRVRADSCAAPARARAICTSASSSRARASARSRGQPQDIHQPVGDLRPDPARGVQRRQRVLRDQRAGGARRAGAARPGAGAAGPPRPAGSRPTAPRPRAAGCPAPPCRSSTCRRRFRPPARAPRPLRPPATRRAAAGRARP